MGEGGITLKRKEKEKKRKLTPGHLFKQEIYTKKSLADLKVPTYGAPAGARRQNKVIISITTVQ